MVLTRVGQIEPGDASRRIAEEFINETLFRREQHSEGAADDDRVTAGARSSQLSVALGVLDLLRLILQPEVREGSRSDHEERGTGTNVASGLTGPAGPGVLSGAGEYRRPVGRERLQAGPVKLDPTSGDVSVNGKPIALSPMEFRVLSLLIANAGRTVRTRAFARLVWGLERLPSRDVLKLHMRNLRRKLGDRYAESNLIVTVRGFGYRMNV